MRHRSRWWLVLVVGAVVLAAEWLRAPGAAGAALAAGVALVAAIGCGSRRRPAGLALASGLVALAVAVAITEYRLAAIERDWPAQREARIEAYGARVGGELRGALRTAVELARRGAAAAALPRDRAFGALASAVPAGGVESSVVILDSDGAPWAWAGRHRLDPDPAGDSLSARASGYYVVLETRRHSAGRTIVAGALIWADRAVADRSRSLAERFRAQTEVGLLVYPPGAAPENNTDIFDYTEPTTGAPRLLFSVQPVPPEQSEARARAFDRGGRAALIVALAVIVVAMVGAPGGTERLLVLAPLVWLVVRAPVGDLFGAGRLFAPLAPSDSLAGLSVSPAALALTGVLLATAAVWVWRRQMRASSSATLGAVAASAAAAMLAARLGGAIAPSAPLDLPMWLVLEAAIVLAGAPLAILAAALLRGAAMAGVWRTTAAVGLALVLGAVAAVGWSPGAAQPAWYPLLWTIPLVVVALPAPRLAGIAGIGIVLGSLATTVLWRADIAGRIRLAEQDIGRLGDTPDPRARALLDRLGGTLAAARVPTSAAELYAIWHDSPLAREGYPAHLALWRGDGTVAAELSLDSLALPIEMIGAVARSVRTAADAREIRTIPTTPGVHHLLVQRVSPGAVVSVAIGPRSMLVAPDRLGRLLDPGPRRAAPYRLDLGAPVADSTSPRLHSGWNRQGWSFHTDRTVMLPGGRREVHASVDLPGAGRLAVRALLVLLMNAALLAIAWGFAGAVTGEPEIRLRWRRAGHSFRLRLALALAAFFVVPTLAYAAWSFSHFRHEAERGRDLLITQKLRDAAQGAGTLLRTPGVPVTDALRGLSVRVGADLALYRGGVLIAASTPVLHDLGVLSPLMDPRAFRALALSDELEMTVDGILPTLAERVGYRVVEFGSGGGEGILATPQVAGATDAGRQQFELGLVLLLATILGILAAVNGAGVAARALSRPVAELRRAALALGRGESAPLAAERPPVEFEPVFGAFNRMAADVRSSQRALEQARLRTDAVLATVATGVVALGPDGQVLIANPRAVDLLGAALAEGRSFVDALSDDWAPLQEAVERYLADPREAAQVQELGVGQRRLTLEMAPLGLDVSGIVLAINDVTDLSRAERVLAWGEMARQVAHEIKNPLTPVRLGIQHLQRVYRDRRGDFESTLDETSERILGEIDRLDTIARAFSRFAAPTESPDPLESVDLAATATEVVQLYALAGDGAAVTIDAHGPAWARARRNEVKEVLVNLLENARNAGARRIGVSVKGRAMRVTDDGAGIPGELVPRIFEPHFSTTTSGAGLGLAIVRRIVESWGGSVEVASEPATGTVVTVTAGVSA